MMTWIVEFFFLTIRFLKRLMGKAKSASYLVHLKTSNGVSINDISCVGPKLQNDNTAILLNWRIYRYVCTTDMVKMYRQILIKDEVRNFQNIVWQSNPD